MLLNGRRMVGVPVRTRSGKHIGKLSDVVLDLETGRVAVVLVRAPGFIPGLLDQELRIAWPQVISMSDTEVVLTDGSIPTGATRIAAALGGRAVPSVEGTQ